MPLSTLKSICDIINFGINIYENKDISSIFKTKYLCYDVQWLKSIYSKENFVDKKIPYVELFNFNDNPNAEILIETDPNMFQLSHDNNSCIKKFQSKALDHFEKNGKMIRNDTSVRLNGVRIEKNKVVFQLMKCLYSDQVMSHLVLDWENQFLKQMGVSTYRGFLLSKWGGKLPPLDTDLLSNSIGISIVIYYKKEGEFIPYIPFRNTSFIQKRRNEPAVFEGVYHCSSSGVLEWNNLRTMDDIKNEMYREIYEETRITKEDLLVVEPIAITRELLRAGKPQIFFIGYTNLTEQEITEKRKQAIIDAKNEGEKVEIRNKCMIFDSKASINKKIFSLELIGNHYYSAKYIEEKGLI